MNAQEAQKTMNSFANANTPFVFIINYKMDNCFVYDTKNIPNNIKFNFPNFNNITCSTINAPIKILKSPYSKKDYVKSYNTAQKHLHRGDSYLINLTGESEITTESSIQDIFYNSFAKFKLLFKDEFVVFSPEPFVQIQNNIIKTFPMKGTISAKTPNAPEIIRNNKKEKAEHATIVDLLRNDLSQVASNVQVESYRYTEKITTNNDDLIQVSSSIKGSIHSEMINKIGDIIFSLLPAGSVTGAPKRKTCEIIEQSETHQRGFYTGVMGYYDGKNLESAVMIRFIEKRNDKLYFKSGGGITTQSNVNDEYNELIQKIYVPIN